ncbi:hypothetical protein LOSG293_011220 [Secundilactobacillus oryzae JCM 18671]|uniref:DUF2187 domain-containing protein n=1 Tax=Secundilactobacillus oryzae JCM 18671 TaxID=1291743 RepID=A0A081BG54_9LACO|nr:hypothetical protein [Secundilactobacillus oryzae]GAK47022.1 hypothetical protein LOSG293_011220 [Secundilactobacillus oryzae JCM 18671]
MAELKLGDYVKAQKFNSLEHDFEGTIEKVYENTVLVHIDKYDPEDRVTVTDFNERAVVSKKVTKLLKASPEVPVEDAKMDA